MTELTDYAKAIIRSNLEGVRELMRRQGRTDQEIARFLDECGASEEESGGSLVDIFADLERVDTDGNRN